MNNKNFEVYFDCGSSKIRAGAFNKNDPKHSIYKESNFFLDHSTIELEIQKVISSLETDTNEYLDNVNLMIDSPDLLSISICLSKKFDGSKLKKEDIKFLIQDAKQQVLKNYFNQSILHIIINNYKINNVNYSYLPENINCKLISLDIFFICIPKETIEYFKKKFFELDISINQIFCSSYAKSIYKKKLLLLKNISFIDIGFNKTSIISYLKNEIVFMNMIPIGSNHITKDLCNVLKLDFQKAENLKLSFNQNITLLNKEKISSKLIQQIIAARVEELLKLCAESIKTNIIVLDENKMILMGEGSKILNNRFMEKILFSYNIELLPETLEDICQSALSLGKKLNKNEVVVIPKKQIKQGFFEKLFHFFN
tara:strand:- start:2765 stop:3871 length:1107 start_codon:yes stop_codon:yes gene_type:complete